MSFECGCAALTLVALAVHDELGNTAVNPEVFEFLEIDYAFPVPITPQIVESLNIAFDALSVSDWWHSLVTSTQKGVPLIPETLYY